MNRLMQLFSLQDAGGSQSFTGGGLGNSTNSFRVCNQNELFFGTIKNTSGVDARLIFRLFDMGSPFQKDILAGEEINLNGLPIDQIFILVNGTVTLKMIGSIVRYDTSKDLQLLLGRNGGFIEFA